MDSAALTILIIPERLVPGMIENVIVAANTILKIFFENFLIISISPTKKLLYFYYSTSLAPFLPLPGFVLPPNGQSGSFFGRLTVNVPLFVPT